MLGTGCDDGLSEAEAVERLGLTALEAGPGAVSDAVELGRALFWDPILSGGRDVACVSCHHPDHAYADGLAVSRGVGATGLGPARRGGVVIDRNSPTILNTAFAGITQRGEFNDAAPLFWDSRVDGLEEQALAQIKDAKEMRGDTISEDAILDEVVARVQAIDGYRALFQQAFGDELVTSDRIASAIADFERSLVALDAPFDRYLAGDQEAMSPRQRRGMRRFVQVGCADCHAGPMLADFELRSIGIASRRQDGSLDEGAEDGKFRTPPLRNIALTAPYMHDGSLATLRDVLEHYEDIGDGGRRRGPFAIDREARRLDLDDDDFGDIEAFLHSLTSDSFDRRIPTTVPSGLPPGGAIE